MVPKLALVAAFLSTSTLARSLLQNEAQQVLDDVSSSEFKCDVPAALDPSEDGLPAAGDIFSDHEALLLQVKRHGTIVKVPSISFDDNGEPGEDSRWNIFYDLHRAFAALYPNL